MSSMIRVRFERFMTLGIPDGVRLPLLYLAFGLYVLSPSLKRDLADYWERKVAPGDTASD